ncbi:MULTISPECIES: glutamate-cysteine ligase family protein [unclassified Bradyrhizobium]|uniref:glutamate-cysteine ligase family protein n=1 Tax=unclassified Bradyrhizobium TaxID=2631580 RepID=UPI0016069301|nr:MULTISPECIES: glutamate-cysteine ligase family protein [unclassified Bradyrhizobium]
MGNTDHASAHPLHLRRCGSLACKGEKDSLGPCTATASVSRRNTSWSTANPQRRKVISDLGMVGLGNPISGLHVHVEVPEPDLRVEIMHRLVPFLPLLLALSTSSPFWCGYPTGLLGYRNAANDALPRTGFPEMFRNLAEYETYVKTLVDAGIVPNASYVWWALRPSLQHPTLELRITDCCTAIADSVAIAAVVRW